MHHRLWLEGPDRDVCVAQCNISHYFFFHFLYINIFRKSHLYFSANFEFRSGLTYYWQLYTLFFLMHFQMSIGSNSTFSVKIRLNMWMRLNKAWQANAASVLGTETWSWRSLDASPTAFNRRKIQEMQLSMSLSASVSDSWYVSHPM